MIRIKICGLTNQEDAYNAVEAGADFLGFIFYPLSPRYVENNRAQAIVAAVKERYGTTAPRCVGVFVDVPEAQIWSIAAQVGLDLVQLHGDESPEAVRRLQPLAYKAIRPRDPSTALEAATVYGDLIDDPERPQILVDAYHAEKRGGTGLQANLAAAHRIAGRYRLMLAGGLTPLNVTQTIRAVRPWGVDVSSGVERERGHKDHRKVEAFIKAARNVAM